MQTTEGVIVIRDKENEVIGFVRKDLVKRANVFYTAKEMQFEEIEQWLGGTLVNNTPVK